MALVSPKTIVISTIPAKRPIPTSFTTYTTPCHTTVIKKEEYSDLEDTENNGPRKRKRLTHLTPEERMMRRKLKNRVAAQTARDRKKMRMQELEEAIAKLEAENKKLKNENSTLKLQTGILTQENTTLREKLGQPSECDGAQSDEEGSLESAAGVDPSCLSGHLAPSELPAHTQSDLLDLLQQIVVEGSEDTEDSQKVIIIEDDSTDNTEVHTTEVVGPSTAELESIKELIHFDHEYFKTTAPSPQPAEPMSEDVVPLDIETDASNAEPVSLSQLDLASFLQENMDSLMDLDALLAEEKVKNKDSISLQSSDENNCNTSALGNATPVIDSSVVKCVTDNVCNSGDDFDFLQSSSHILQTNKSSPATLSESGYGSEISDIGSPISEESLFGEHDWEESFTELFPSLV